MIEAVVMKLVWIVERMMDWLMPWSIESWRDPWLGLWALLFASCVANLDVHRRFQRSIRSAPQFDPLEALPDSLPSVSVIIPAYNEAENIADCMAAVAGQCAARRRADDAGGGG